MGKKQRIDRMSVEMFMLLVRSITNRSCGLTLGCGGLIAERADSVTDIHLLAAGKAGLQGGSRRGCRRRRGTVAGCGTGDIYDVLIFRSDFLVAQYQVDHRSGPETQYE